MSNPEDDPQIVTQVAATLFGSDPTKDPETALLEAWAWLKQSRTVIDREKDPTKAELKDLCAKGQPRYEVHSIGSGVAMLVDYLFPEQVFIDELVKGLTQDKRPDRRKDSAIKWWARLRRLRSDAPDIADSRTWTLNTLKAWKEAFDKIYQNERKEINAANLQTRKRKRPPAKSKKTSKDI